MIGRIHVEVQLDPPYGFPLEDGSLAPIASSVIPIGELGDIYSAFEQARRQLVGHVVQSSQEVNLQNARELTKVRQELEDERAQRVHFQNRAEELEGAS